MNPFEAHGIEHLSPSACNQWAASPAAFVMQRVLKKSMPVGAAAHRGSAVETGIAHGLLNPKATAAECTMLADRQFSTLTAMSSDPRVEKERGGLQGLVEQGLTALRPYGVPCATQREVKWQVEGVSVPFTGYSDFEYEDGTIIDLKTTLALPSKIGTSHARQVALYAAFYGQGAKPLLAYVTPKKSALYQLENVEDHVKALANIGRSIQKFLSISSDPMELAQFVVPDVDSFYFSDPVTRQAAYEVWGV